MRAALCWIAVVAALTFNGAAALRAESASLATQADVEEARAVLAQWVAAYQAEDYRAQWRLTDPRIRRWWDERRWRKGMTKARRRDGKLTAYEIVAADPIDAAKLPCTEMGHCYRQGVQYVAFIVRSTYERRNPDSPNTPPWPSRTKAGASAAARSRTARWARPPSS